MIFGDIKLSRADYSHIFIVCLLVLIGLATIYSASYQVESATLKTNFAKQILWFFISIIVLAIIIIIPLRVFWTVSYWAYGISMILLIMPLFFARVADVHRWIVLGPFKFQPSEFAKIGVLLAIARYLAEDKRNLNKAKEPGDDFNFAAPLPAEQMGDIANVSQEKIDSLFDNLKE